jgi:DNA-binding NarL/FixJ family response regulator
LDRPIRVLLADDHAVVRRGLRLFLNLQEGLEVVGEAADGAEAAELAGLEAPDVVVMDLSMPGVDGLEATRLVRAAHGGAKVLVLSSFVDERVLPALRAGAEGYLTKDAEPAELAAAIRSVHAGEPIFCPDALRRLTRELVGGQLRPEGTVTIAFTDVEESTWLLETLGERDARDLLREHDNLVRAALEDHRGIEVEREGDAFMLAFSGARPAVQCAAAIQRALDEQPLRVRIGLNTGDVIAEEAGYFGRTVFLASRIAGQAGGGEILVSDVTRALAGDQPGVRYVDRGEHELKGFAGQHRLWAVDWR